MYIYELRGMNVMHDGGKDTELSRKTDGYVDRWWGDSR